MSLLDVLRAGVKIADQVTKPLQSSVKFERFISSDSEGHRTYASPIYLLAIVDWRQQQVRTSTGVLSVSRAQVMFLDVVALKAATNDNGVNDYDRITLPDNTTGPILTLSGFMDPGTAKPVATEVFIG